MFLFVAVSWNLHSIPATHPCIVFLTFSPYNRRLNQRNPIFQYLAMDPSWPFYNTSSNPLLFHHIGACVALAQTRLEVRIYNEILPCSHRCDLLFHLNGSTPFSSLIFFVLMKSCRSGVASPSSPCPPPVLSRLRSSSSLPALLYWSVDSPELQRKQRPLPLTAAFWVEETQHPWLSL